MITKQISLSSDKDSLAVQPDNSTKMKTQKCKQCAAYKREIEKLKGSIRALQTRAGYFEESAARAASIDKAICKITAALLEVPPAFHR